MDIALRGFFSLISFGLVPAMFYSLRARAAPPGRPLPARRRDTDRLLPAIAGHWRPGDRVEVLYLADEGYDSVVMSAG